MLNCYSGKPLQAFNMQSSNYFVTNSKTLLFSYHNTHIVYIKIRKISNKPVKREDLRCVPHI